MFGGRDLLAWSYFAEYRFLQSRSCSESDSGAEVTRHLIGSWSRITEVFRTVPAGICYRSSVRELFSFGKWKNVGTPHPTHSQLAEPVYRGCGRLSRWFCRVASPLPAAKWRFLPGLAAHRLRWASSAKNQIATWYFPEA